MMTTSPLLDMQAPGGMPLSTEVRLVSDPLLPAQASREALAHFFDEIYNLAPESHLSRLLAILLGDSGVGSLRKKFTYVQISQTIHTSHFYDIDRLFADVFGFRRFLSEALMLDPYVQGGTLEEWEAVLAADASYRNRVEQFIRGVNWGATLTGMYQVSAAVLASPVRIYESYHAIDDSETYDPGVQDTFNDYGDLEEFYYGEMDTLTYGELEGLSAYQGRANASRTEFIVRPLREITAEEKYHLLRVLDRLKPVGSMLTIDPRGVEGHIRVPVTRIATPSSYWSVRQQIVAEPANAGAYPRYDSGNPVEQPRPVFTDYPGDEWFYNGDILDVEAYAVQDGEVIQTFNYERVVEADTGEISDFLPEAAFTSSIDIARGRSVRDGVMTASAMERIGL